MHKFQMALLLGLAALAMLPVGAEAQQGFLRDGDVWVFLGDSITDAGPYRRTLERVCRFYHPEAKLTFVNHGVAGSLATATQEQFAQAAAADRPTIVSLMTGMNNTINSGWRLGDPTAPNIAEYRNSIIETVRRMKNNGLTVLLMGPTYTDESLEWASSWELAGTRELLEAYNREVAEITRQEGVIFLPVGEEFEAYQRSLKPENVLRQDGVHPHAAGQYQIARTILHHLNLAAPLDGDRQALATPPADCPVEVTLAARRLPPTATGIPLTLSTAAAGPYIFTWSYRLAETTYTKQSRAMTLTGKDSWTLPLPAKLPQNAGQAADVLLEVMQGTARRLYLFDLATVPVLHPVDGVVSGVVDTAGDRPGGKRVATWRLSFPGKAMVFEADVSAAEIRSDYTWPWGRDGITLWLDLRPPERFADIGLDSDVYQTLITMHEQPIFGSTLVDWTGRGISAATTTWSEKTATGYRVRFALEGKLSKWNTFDATQHDFIGISPVFVEHDAQNQPRFYASYTPERPYDHYANSLMIVDLKNQLAGDKVVNVAVSRL